MVFLLGLVRVLLSFSSMSFYVSFVILLNLGVLGGYRVLVMLNDLLLLILVMVVVGVRLLEFLWVEVLVLLGCDFD